MKFIKDSIRELKHVVWPTRKESINHFIVVNIILICFGIYLAFFTAVFTKSLAYLKSFVSQTQTTTTYTENPVVNTGNVEVEVKTGETSEVNTGKIENSTGVENTNTSSISTGNVSN